MGRNAQHTPAACCPSASPPPGTPLPPDVQRGRRLRVPEAASTEHFLVVSRDKRFLLQTRNGYDHFHQTAARPPRDNAAKRHAGLRGALRLYKVLELQPTPTPLGECSARLGTKPPRLAASARFASRGHRTAPWPVVGKRHIEVFFFVCETFNFTLIKRETLDGCLCENFWLLSGQTSHWEC